MRALLAEPMKIAGLFTAAISLLGCNLDHNQWLDLPERGQTLILLAEKDRRTEAHVIDDSNVSTWTFRADAPLDVTALSYDQPAVALGLMPGKQSNADHEEAAIRFHTADQIFVSRIDDDGFVEWAGTGEIPRSVATLRTRGPCQSFALEPVEGIEGAPTALIRIDDDTIWVATSTASRGPSTMFELSNGGATELPLHLQHTIGKGVVLTDGTIWLAGERDSREAFLRGTREGPFVELSGGPDHPPGFVAAGEAEGPVVYADDKGDALWRFAEERWEMLHDLGVPVGLGRHITRHRMVWNGPREVLLLDPYHDGILHYRNGVITKHVPEALEINLTLGADQIVWIRRIHGTIFAGSLKGQMVRWDGARFAHVPHAEGRSLWIPASFGLGMLQISFLGEVDAAADPLLEQHFPVWGFCDNPLRDNIPWEMLQLGSEMIIAYAIDGRSRVGRLTVSNP